MFIVRLSIPIGNVTDISTGEKSRPACAEIPSVVSCTSAILLIAPSLLISTVNVSPASLKV